MREQDETRDVNKAMREHVREWVPGAFISEPTMSEAEALRLLKELNPDDYNALRSYVTSRSDKATTQTFEVNTQTKENGNAPALPSTGTIVPLLCKSHTNSLVNSGVSTVTNHVTKTEGPCNEKPPTHVTSHVTNHVTSHVTNWHNKVKMSDLTDPVRYAIDASSVDKTIENLVTLAYMQNKPIEAVLETIRAARLAVLFPSANLGKLARSKFERRGRRKSKESTTRLPRFYFETVCKNLIPSEELNMGSRSKLLIVELAIVAKSITNRIIVENEETGATFADINNNYFIKTNFAREYKKATGRSIGKGRNKVVAITNLLNRYGIIEKVERWDNDSKRRLRNRYAMGVNNPFQDRLD